MNVFAVNLRPLQTIFLVCLVVLPWLMSPGNSPSPATGTWLFCLMMVGAFGVLAAHNVYAASGLSITSFICIALLIVLRGQNVEAFGALSAIAAICCSAQITSSLKSDENVETPIAYALLIAGLTSSIIGFCQYFRVTEYFEPWISRSPNGEVFGNLHQRNQFASLCNISLAALLYLSRKEIGVSGRVTAICLSPVAAVLSVALYASASRTGFLELVFLSAAALNWGAWRQRNARLVLTIVWLFYLLAAVMLPLLAQSGVGSGGIVTRWQIADLACSSRLILWSNVLDLIKLRPFLGWGWAELDFAHFVTPYDGPRFCEILDNAHNLPLHLAVELGIPASLAICLGGGWAINQRKPWREGDIGRQLAWQILAALLIHSLLEYPIWYGPFQIAMGIAIGLLWQNKAQIAQPHVWPIPEKLNAGLLAAVLLIGAVYATWDYHRISQIYRAPGDRSPAYRTNTLEKIRSSWLFHNQVAFAELTLTSVTPENAEAVNKLAHEVLHFSPEAKVVEKVIQSARILGREAEAIFFEERYKAAYPETYRRWKSRNN